MLAALPGMNLRKARRLLRTMRGSQQIGRTLFISAEALAMHFHCAALKTLDIAGLCPAPRWECAVRLSVDASPHALKSWLPVIVPFIRALVHAETIKQP